MFHCTVSVKLRKQIQSATIDDQDIFLNINTVSLATVDCVLRRVKFKLNLRVVYRESSDEAATQSNTFELSLLSFKRCTNTVLGEFTKSSVTHDWRMHSDIIHSRVF